MAEPWYAQGLRFSCTRCGHCCTGEPGRIWISEPEIARLAQRLGLDAQAFRQRYTYTVYRRGVSLSEKPGGACIFWQAGLGCTVYEDRPRQCRTWPFWRGVLASPESWEEAAQECPGMNQGKLHQATDITALCADDGIPSRG